MPFTPIRHFLTLPQEPTLPITWFLNRDEAIKAKTGDLHVTHCMTYHPLTHQHGVGSSEAVTAWNTWAILVNSKYPPSRLQGIQDHRYALMDLLAAIHSTEREGCKYACSCRSETVDEAIKFAIEEDLVSRYRLNGVYVAALTRKGMDAHIHLRK